MIRFVRWFDDETLRYTMYDSYEEIRANKTRVRIDGSRIFISTRFL